MSLISNNAKEKFGKVFDQIHETFQTPITVINKGEKTIVSSDPNYNPVYGNRPNQNSFEYTKNTDTIYVRILYSQPDDIKNPDLSNNDILKLLLNNNEIRIKAKKEDYEKYFKNSTKIEVDGKTFKTSTSPKLHGLFDRNYVTIFLKEID